MNPAIVKAHAAVQWTVKNVINQIPGWVTVGLVMAAGASLQALESDHNVFSDMTSWSTAWPDIRTALFAGVTVLWGYLKTDPWKQAAEDRLKRSEAPTPSASTGK